MAPPQPLPDPFPLRQATMSSCDSTDLTVIPPAGLTMPYTSVKTQLENLTRGATLPRRGIMTPERFVGLFQFYEDLIDAVHPEYTLDCKQFSVEKRCWYWCYEDEDRVVNPPFPGISPFTVESEEWYDHIHFAEMAISPAFEVAAYHTPASFLPTAPLYNPWRHLDMIMPWMRKVWYDNDRLKRRAAGMSDRGLGDFNHPVLGKRIDAWVDLWDAVILISQSWNIREMDGIVVYEQDGPPDLYSVIHHLEKLGQVVLHRSPKITLKLKVTPKKG